MKSTSESSSLSFWAIANKVIAAAVATFAAVPPAAMIYGGIMRHVQADTPPSSAVAAAPVVPDAPVPSATSAAPSPQPASPGAAPEAPVPAVNTAAGQQVYMTVCVACHQPTGMGLPNMFPPLAGTDWVNAPKPDRIIRNVLHGVTGPISINGKPFTTPAPLMPPQGAALDDQKIADVLTYVRSSWGNKANAVTPDQVKAIREAEKARTAMWTEAELLKIPDR
ncbi:MAG: c-type cytochrome [Verrucomicrobiaceae bacterium]|nr:c-type cytochrome [Verrucomicrobiaceae bacterium]